MFLVVIVFTMLLREVQNDSESERHLSEDEISECEIGQCVQTCCVRDAIPYYGTNCTNSADMLTYFLNMNVTFPNFVDNEVMRRKCNETILISPGAIDFIEEDGLNVLQSLQLTLNYTQFCVDTATFNASLLICILENTFEHSTETPFESLKKKCVGMNCIRKCCGLEQSIFDGSCADTMASNFSLSGINFTDDTQLLIHSELKCDDGYLKIRIDDFKPNHDGSIYWEEGGSIFEIDSYCMDEFSGSDEMDYGDDGSNIAAFICVEDDEEDDIVENQMHLTGMIISMPFLLLTFLVYAILPETSLHRKALMSYVLTLFAGYVFLVVTQLSNSIPNELCHVMGYSIIFFFTVSFFWMNVMCIDMWLAFSGMKVYNGMRGTEKKRFLFYCLYAWGVPLLHVFIVFMINTFGDKTSVYYPHLGTKRCYVEDGLPELFYFYLPMAIVIVINIVLFILTTVRIQQVKRETAMLKQTDSKRHSYEDDKQKFNLYLKLMLAMGINWSMEVISWAVTWKLTKAPTWIWYLTDFTNATYGAVIFFIFVFKKKIWISLKKRYYVWMGKPHLAHAMSRTTHGTRTSNFSTTDTTTVNNDYRMSNMKNGREEERALN